MTEYIHLLGASKKAAMVEAPPAPAPPASEKAAPEQKIAVIQTESIKCDSGWNQLEILKTTEL